MDRHTVDGSRRPRHPQDVGRRLRGARSSAAGDAALMPLILAGSNASSMARHTAIAGFAR